MEGRGGVEKLTSLSESGPEMMTMAGLKTVSFGGGIWSYRLDFGLKSDMEQ